MAVLIPRIRMLGIRLSADEYASLERCCVERGARSISDLARSAICSFLKRADEEAALASTVSHNAEQVKDLEAKIARMAEEIAHLKAASSAAAGRIKGGGEC